MTYREALYIWWRRCIMQDTWRQVAWNYTGGQTSNQLVGEDACIAAMLKLPSWWPGRWN